MHKEWAMNETDIELLINYPAHKGAECRENAGEYVLQRRANQLQDVFFH